ncbi:MAG: hypothetical protein ACTSVI_00365 [Promethearchaeota archaeon]
MNDNFNEKIKGYSLSIYHFNLQYNAGNEKSYHILIKKSFRPFLDFYLKYPQFKASCEIQGHAIAFMARHYSKELDKLVTLVMDRKQIELVSVHYSDQVYLAYPRFDLEYSMDINDEILENHGLKRGGTFFAQENFFGPGVIPVMKKHGYKVALLNKHYLRHYQGEIPQTPYFERDGIFFLSGTGYKNANGENDELLSKKDVQIPELIFDYWGDGELAFTRGNNYFPFHGPSEKKKLKRLALYINRHKNGYKTEFCTKYVEVLQDKKIKPEPLPIVLDGSWNYPSYGGVYLWMGRYRFWWEKDGYVRSHTYKTREMLLAANTMLNELKNPPEYFKNQYKLGWKHLLLAEVSDSTGQSPVPTEVKYSFMESNKARTIAKNIISWAKNKLGYEKDSKLLINTKDNSITLLDNEQLKEVLNNNKGTPSSLKKLKEDIGDLGMQVFNMKRLTFKITKRPINENDPSHVEYYFNLDFQGKPTRFLTRLLSIIRQNTNFSYHQKYDEHFSNYVGISFKWLENKFIFSPALMEESIQEIPTSQFKILDTIGKTFLPLPNGLIGLGNDIYIIKHNNHGNTHIAATLDLKKMSIGFIQDGPPSQLKSRWKFSIIKTNKKDAVNRAIEINVLPKIII